MPSSPESLEMHNNVQGFWACEMISESPYFDISGKTVLFSEVVTFGVRVFSWPCNAHAI